MARRSVGGYIAWYLDTNPSQAEQLGQTILDAALHGDSVAGLACVLAIAFADDSDYDEDGDGEEE